MENCSGLVSDEMLQEEMKKNEWRNITQPWHHKSDMSKRPQEGETVLGIIKRGDDNVPWLLNYSAMEDNFFCYNSHLDLKPILVKWMHIPE